MGPDIKCYREKYSRELTDSIIPFWENHCMDYENGGYFSCLDRDGSVYDTTKYMWVQWRIVYMFATLYKSEFSQRQYLTYARNGAQFLLTHRRDDSGQFYFALNKKGEPTVAPYSIYSECFAAMGCAALFNATQDEYFREQACSAMNSYKKRIPAPKGRWEKTLTAQTKYDTLGHYMILANLGYVLNENCSTDEFTDDIHHACTTVLNRFWNAQCGILFENIMADGAFDLESSQGRHLNPGHALEAMWFIMQFAERTGDTAMIEKTLMITEATLKSVWDKEYGGIFYFKDVLNRPKFELESDMKLWWVHNEASIAALYAYVISRNETFLQWFKTIDEWSWSHFPDKEFGEWFGYLNRRGIPVNFQKGGKWKSFFHIPRFLLTCNNLLERIG